MPKQGLSETVELVNKTTGEVVKDFKSLRACSRYFGLNTNNIIKKTKTMSTIGEKGEHILRYKKPQNEVTIQQPPKSWTCKVHKVWVGNDYDCPLCEQERRFYNGR